MRKLLFLIAFLMIFSFTLMPSLAVTNYIEGFQYPVLTYTGSISTNVSHLSYWTWTDYTANTSSHGALGIIKLSDQTLPQYCEFNVPVDYGFITDYGMTGTDYSNFYLHWNDSTHYDNIYLYHINKTCQIYETQLALNTIKPRFNQLDIWHNETNSLSNESFIIATNTNQGNKKYIFQDDNYNATTLIGWNANFDRFQGYSNDLLYSMNYFNLTLDIYNATTGLKIYQDINFTGYYDMPTTNYVYLFSPYSNNSNTSKLIWIGFYYALPPLTETNTLNLYLTDLNDLLINPDYNYTTGNWTGGGGDLPPPLPVNPTLSDITGYFFGNWLGISSTRAKIFVSLITSIIVSIVITGYLGIKRVHGGFILGIITFLVMILVFTLGLAWLPTWLTAILVVLSSGLMFGMLTGKLGGG